VDQFHQEKMSKFADRARWRWWWSILRTIAVACRRCWCGQQKTTKCELVAADPIGQETELADAHQAGGKHMQQEPAQELDGSSVRSLVRL
jgi:hypothetical protein